MTKRRRLKSTRQFRPFRDELPSRLALTDDQRGWLLRLLHNPIRRDANEDPLPYGMATVLLDYQLIEPGTESSRGAIAAMTWRVWRLTESGRRTARQISDNPHREIVRIT